MAAQHGGPAHFPLPRSQAWGDMYFLLMPTPWSSLGNGETLETPLPHLSLSFFPSSTPTTDWGPGYPLERRIQPPWAVVTPEPGAGQVSSMSSLPPASEQAAPRTVPRATGSLKGHWHVRRAGCGPQPLLSLWTICPFPSRR